MQRFTDWMTLSELAGNFSVDLLGELGYGSAQGKLRRDFRDRRRWETERQARTGEWAMPIVNVDEPSAQRMADSVVRRVLSDL
jgi:hypothetical protein